MNTGSLAFDLIFEQFIELAFVPLTVLVTHVTVALVDRYKSRRR